jgi:Tol biopolymer transport system component
MHRRTLHRFTLLVGLLLFAAGLFTLLPTSHAQQGPRCFDGIANCIDGRIREYWEQNGGLPVFGLPITPLQEETIDGQTLQVQWFERNRLELHPGNERPYDVLLGRLGAEAVEDTGAPPREEPREGCAYFDETGYNVCGDFLAYWQANGLELDGVPGTTAQESLALFGYPLTGEFETTLEDGNRYVVQWFERARFERHPENQPPFNVLLSRLGVAERGEPELGPAAPAPAAVDDRIVFELLSPRGDRDIYTVNPDGSGLTQITATGDAGSPSWSPDKSRITFTREDIRNRISDIYVMNADGSGQTQLTSDGSSSEPAWSPDGSRIAFTRGDFGNTDIYVMNADGTGATNLTNNPASDQNPDWSPDGSLITFVSNRDAGPYVPGAIFREELFIMNSDGSQPRRIETGTNAGGPRFSPDGTRIAFHPMRNDPGPLPLFTINTDGSGRVEVATGFWPAWSPDGSQLAFVDFLTPGGADGSLHIVNVDGTGRTLLVENGWDPDW